MGNPRVLMLCADDYGLDTAANAAIVRLAGEGRLAAVSCCTAGGDWLGMAAALDGLAVEVGLHVNLTQGRPLSPRLRKVWPRFPSLTRLMTLAWLDRLPRAALRSELHAQLSAFIAARQARPAFIDGHRHVHHLPVVRDMLLEMAEHIQPLPAVRSTVPTLGPGYGLQRWWVGRTGGRALADALRERVLPHNPALLGVYDGRGDYGAHMRTWLREVPAEGALLVCHPADPAEARRMGEGESWRTREAAYLASPAFPEDLAAANVVLGPVWRQTL